MELFKALTELNNLSEKILTKQDKVFIDKMKEAPENTKLVDEYIATQYTHNHGQQYAFFRGMCVGTFLIMATLTKGAGKNGN